MGKSERDVPVLSKVKAKLNEIFVNRDLIGTREFAKRGFAYVTNVLFVREMKRPSVTYFCTAKLLLNCSSFA